MKGLLFVSLGSECGLSSEKLSVSGLILSTGMEPPYFSLLENKGKNHNSFSTQLFFKKLSFYLTLLQ